MQNTRHPSMLPTTPQVFPSMRPPILNTQNQFPPLIDPKANGHHRHHLEIANAQPHPEPTEPLFRPHPPGRLAHAQPMAVAHGATDLHAPPNDFERVGRRLRDQACKAACEELRPGFKRGPSGGGRMGGVGEGGIGRKGRVA